LISEPTHANKRWVLQLSGLLEVGQSEESGLVEREGESQNKKERQNNQTVHHKPLI